MNKSELYALLFTDSFTSNLAINTNLEFIVYSMKTFGGYNVIHLIVLSSAAMSLAFCANYLLGMVLSFAFKQSSIEINEKFKLDFKYLVFILLLSAVPFFGKFISLFAGFLRINILKVLPVCISAKICYYLVTLL